MLKHSDSKVYLVTTSIFTSTHTYTYTHAISSFYCRKETFADDKAELRDFKERFLKGTLYIDDNDCDVTIILILHLKLTMNVYVVVLIKSGG